MTIAGGVVRLPYQYRAAAQLWDWAPWRYLNAENVFDVRMLPVFGHCFASWEIVPVIYILITAVAAAGNIAYRNYQVSAR